MSSKDEAMKLALEALIDHVYMSQKKRADAITALRQAIKQQEQDWSLLEATQESLREHMAEIKRLRAALEQAEKADQFRDATNMKQEPVAWKHLWQLDSNEKQEWPMQHEHTPDCFAHGCRFNVSDGSVPESVCEAYGWLFHETNGDHRVNKARQLLRDSLTKDQQKCGIKIAKENGATVKRMSTR